MSHKTTVFEGCLQPALVHPTFPHHCPLETLLLTLPPFPHEERGARQPKPVTQGHSQVGLSSKPSSALDLSSLLYTRSEWVPLQEPLFRKATRLPDSAFRAQDVGLPFLPSASDSQSRSGPPSSSVDLPKRRRDARRWQTGLWRTS